MQHIFLCFLKLIAIFLNTKKIKTITEMKKTLQLSILMFALAFISPKITYSQTYNAVLEYCTGTWCQWCPCGHSNVHDILSNYPNTVVLAYHGAGSDPWQTYTSGIRSLFGFSAYPSGVVGRKTGIITYSAWNNEVVLQTLLTQPGVSIVVNNKSYDAGTRTLTATIKVTANTNLNGEFYINYVLTENNLVYPQTGNGSCAGGSNYVHGHAVKSMMNGDIGELIHSGEWSSGQEVIRNLTYVLPNSPQVSVPENCDLNIFVYKQGSSISSNSNIQQSLRTPVIGTTGVQNTSALVKGYELSQNYPNPFNPTTSFTFSVPKEGLTSLKFYDALGNEVATYIDGVIKVGTYSVEFDGSGLSSGVYFYTLVTSDFKETKRMILTK
ncbi:MAG: hypothetical protein HGGPFJEG_00345 [Ignavibacteria bacterium]|nr:hypothetical protein [Ignavibacteria bacterium]